MVLFDASNPYARVYFEQWVRQSRRTLDAIRENLPDLAAESRRREAEEAREGSRAPRPLAVVYDVDEVLLCNLSQSCHAEAPGPDGSGGVDFHAADAFEDPLTGRPWGRGNPRDPPLPGALELLRATVGLGLIPFYVTGRLESIRGETLEDFRSAGFSGREGAPVPAPLLSRTLVMCPDGEAPGPGESIRPWKERQRAEIEKTYRIVLNVGDQLSDLGRHGDRQALLPHPFYVTP